VFCVLAVGKTKNVVMKRLIDDYLQRIGHFKKCEYQEVLGSSLLRLIEDEPFIVVLDVKGREVSSEEFAMFLKEYEGEKRIAFVIGDENGFDRAVKERARVKLSLSKMTFPHELVRVVFLEQLYRACTILKGLPYHK